MCLQNILLLEKNNFNKNKKIKNFCLKPIPEIVNEYRSN